MIDRAEVRRIAQLAELDLDEAEIERFTGEIGRILEHVSQLRELDLGGVEPTAHVARERLPLRPDEPAASLDRARVLAQAPRTAQDGFAVPAFVDEG